MGVKGLEAELKQTPHATSSSAAPSLKQLLDASVCAAHYSTTKHLYLLLVVQTTHIILTKYYINNNNKTHTHTHIIFVYIINTSIELIMVSI